MMFRKNFQKIIGGILISTIVALQSVGTAKLVAPHIIPAKAANVLSVPDMAALQKAWKNSAFAALMANVIEMTPAKEAMTTFQSFLPEIEKELGFSLNAETVSSMLSGFDVFMEVSGADQPVVGAVVKIGDKGKFERFVTYWEKAATKAAREASADEQTSESKDRDFITSESLEGHSVKHFVAGNGMEVYYTLVGAHFLICSDKEQLADMIARTEGKMTRGDFAHATDFEKVTKTLTERPGVIYLYQNTEAANAATQSNEQMKKLNKILRDLTPFAMTGMSLQIEQKQLRSYKYAPFMAGTENHIMRRLLERAATSGKLDIFNFAPQQTMLVGVTNAFDAYFVYDMLRELAESVAGGTKDTDLDKQLKELEPLMGFSVKDDLLLALGKQLGFFLNSLDISAGMFSVDVDLVIEVRDKDKMQKVLSAIERMITDKAKTMVPPPPAGTNQKDQTPTIEVSFKTAKDGDLVIRYLDIPPFPAITPGYAFMGDFLIIGSSKESIQKLAAVKAGKEKSLASSSVLAQLGEIKPQGVSFGYMDFSAVWDATESAMNQLAPSENANKVLNALRAIKLAGGYATVQQGAVTGEGILILE